MIDMAATVKELIEKLKEFPEDLRVINYEFFDLDNVEIVDDGEEKVVMID